MDQLEVYASLAEVFGALTIIIGGVFAFLQYSEFKKIRRSQVAVDLCRQFSAPETARAFRLVRELPNDVTSSQLEEIGSEYADAIMVVGMAMETMGLQVYQGIASFQTVDELAGGMVRTVWSRINVWVEEVRREESNPEFAEWMQWLYEQLERNQVSQGPAYEIHKNWRG